MRSFANFLNAFKGIQLNKDNAVNATPLNHLLTSSMYAQQKRAYLNSYETGLNKSDIKNIVENTWHIFDKPNAFETLEDLLYKNEDENLNIVYMSFNNSIAGIDILKTKLPDNQNIFDYYTEIYLVLKKVIPELIEKKVVNYPIELTAIKDSGWNIGRAAFLARCLYDLGYLNKEELIGYLEKCYYELKRYCNTWKEYTTSYILGSAMCKASNIAEMISIAEDLLMNGNSPLKNKTYI